MDRKERVFLTGASGFVAMHIMRELVERGYAVTATVRSPAKAHDIFSLYPSWKTSVSFEYVPDIVEEEAFTEIFKKNQNEFRYIIHTASPVNFTVTDIQKELIDPAVKGVSNIIRDAHAFGGTSIKRFVLLASAVAVLNSFEDMSKAGKPYNEDDWNPVTTQDAISANSPVLGYNVSKVLAEKAAWDFVSSTVPKPSFDVATINPDIIIGPPLQRVTKPEAMNETNMFAVYNFFNGTYKRIENTTFPFYHFVDVRDVASATVAAMTTLPAGGRRIVLVADAISPQLVKNSIEKNFPQLEERLTAGGNREQIFPVGVDPTKWDLTRSSAILSQWEGLDGKKWEYRGLETSVVDTVAKILQLEDEWANQQVEEK